MTDDFIRYGTLGGKYAGRPSDIAELFEEGNPKQIIHEPLIRNYFNGRKEKWPTALEYINYYVDLFRQWAYRQASGDTNLLREIDNYISGLYEWLKQGSEKGQLDKIELARLKAQKESLTEKLSDYIPERLISGGHKSIEEMLDNIQRYEYAVNYPPEPSFKWQDSEIEKLCLRYETIKLLMRLIEKLYSECAAKYHYIFRLDKLGCEIISYIGTLEISRDKLDWGVVDGNIEEHKRQFSLRLSTLKELREEEKQSEKTELNRLQELIGALRKYRETGDKSALPPIRSVSNLLDQYEKQYAYDKSIDVIIMLGRAVRHEAGYYSELLDKLSGDEFLRDLEKIKASSEKGKTHDLAETGQVRMNINFTSGEINAIEYTIKGLQYWADEGYQYTFANCEANQQTVDEMIMRVTGITQNEKPLTCRYQISLLNALNQFDIFYERILCENETMAKHIEAKCNRLKEYTRDIPNEDDAPAPWVARGYADDLVQTLQRIVGTSREDSVPKPAKTEQMPKDFLFEMAQKVSKWVIDEMKLKRFQEQVKAFYDDYQEWDEEKQTPNPLDRLVLPYATCRDAHIGLLVGDDKPERLSIPFEKEKSLQADYVLLTIIHDRRLRNPRIPMISDGIWSIDEEWIERKWMEISKGYACGSGGIQTHIELALNSVETDLDKLLAETGQENEIEEDHKLEALHKSIEHAKRRGYKDDLYQLEIELSTFIVPSYSDFVNSLEIAFKELQRYDDDFDINDRNNYVSGLLFDKTHEYQFSRKLFQIQESINIITNTTSKALPVLRIHFDQLTKNLIAAIYEAGHNKSPEYYPMNTIGRAWDNMKHFYKLTQNELSSLVKLTDGKIPDQNVGYGKAEKLAEKYEKWASVDTSKPPNGYTWMRFRRAIICEESYKNLYKEVMNYLLYTKNIDSIDKINRIHGKLWEITINPPDHYEGENDIVLIENAELIDKAKQLAASIREAIKSIKPATTGQTTIKKIDQGAKPKQLKAKWVFNEGQVFYGEIDLDISGLGLEVLKKIVEADGLVVTKSSLENEATRYAHYIGDIRKKLKAKNIPCIIKTVTGEGYKLIYTAE